MEIKSSSIDSDKISLSTTTPVLGLTLSYGTKLSQALNILDINSTEITITKEALGVDSLDNTYFKVYLFDEGYEHQIYKGLYYVDVVNDNKAYDYNVLKFKQELDNLTYYDEVVRSLTQKEAFQEANDFFFNYLNFLEKKLNGNNFIQNIKRQSESNT